MYFNFVIADATMAMKGKLTPLVYMMCWVLTSTRYMESEGFGTSAEFELRCLKNVCLNWL